MRAELKADALLVVELALAASLFGPLPLAWAYASGALLPEAAPGRLALAVAGFVACGSSTLVVARRAEGARLKARKQAGHPEERELLSPLLVGLTIVVVGIFAWWFLIESRGEGL